MKSYPLLLLLSISGFIALVSCDKDKAPSEQPNTTPLIAPCSATSNNYRDTFYYDVDSIFTGLDTEFPYSNYRIRFYDLQHPEVSGTVAFVNEPSTGLFHPMDTLNPASQTNQVVIQLVDNGFIYYTLPQDENYIYVDKSTAKLIISFCPIEVVYGPPFDFYGSRQLKLEKKL